MVVTCERMMPSGKIAKRCFDTFTSLVGLVLTTPILIIIAILIKMTSKGPVFYRGVRIGEHGKSFRIYKFRTMVVNAETKGPKNVPDTDYRITKVGRYLRRTKLDELPQLINVLIGEMSFVGPRPDIPEYAALYSDEEAKLILSLRPGITDWASIINYDQYIDFTAATDPDKEFLELIRPLKVKLQLLYAGSNSFWLDIWIIILTLGQIIGIKGTLPKKVQSLVQEYTDRPRQKNESLFEAND